MTVLRRSAVRVDCPHCGVRVLEGNLARHLKTHEPLSGRARGVKLAAEIRRKIERSNRGA
jgi:hypothetical protein